MAGPVECLDSSEKEQWVMHVPYDAACMTPFMVQRWGAVEIVPFRSEGVAEERPGIQRSKC